MKTVNNNIPDSVPCPIYMARLHQAEVDPAELLKLIAAVWLFSDRNYGRRVKDDKHWDYFTGGKVMDLSRIMVECQGQSVEM